MAPVKDERELVGLAPGAGDWVRRSPSFSRTPLVPKAEVVPSDVWMFLVTGGSVLALWCFFDLKRKDIVGEGRWRDHAQGWLLLKTV